MIKVELGLLPRYGNSTKVNWKKSIGGQVFFFYNKQGGVLKIVDVKNVGKGSDKHIKIEYNGKQTWITRASLVNGDFVRFLEVKTKRKVKIERSEYYKGQILKSDTRSIKLLKEGYRTCSERVKVRGFIYECQDCGHKGFKPLSHIRKGSGCKNWACRNKESKVV